MVRTNLLGVLYCTRALLPAMRAARRGAIVNVGSIAGLIPVPHMSVYSATKWAVTGLSESLNAELSREGIHVGVVCPFIVETPLTTQSPRRPFDPHVALEPETVARGDRLSRRAGLIAAPHARAHGGGADVDGPAALDAAPRRDFEWAARREGADAPAARVAIVALTARTRGMPERSCPTSGDGRRSARVGPRDRHARSLRAPAARSRRAPQRPRASRSATDDLHHGGRRLRAAGCRGPRQILDHFPMRGVPVMGNEAGDRRDASIGGIRRRAESPAATPSSVTRRTQRSRMRHRARAARGGMARIRPSGVAEPAESARRIRPLDREGSRRRLHRPGRVPSARSAGVACDPLRSRGPRRLHLRIRHRSPA
jgi:hypothetical protein